MKRHVSIFLLSLISFISIQCEENKDPTEQTGVFDEVYQEMLTNYAYFDLYPFSLNDKFQAFRQQIGPETTDEELFQIMADFIETFEDGHVTVYTPYGISTFQFWPEDYVTTSLHELYLDELVFASGAIQYGHISNSSLGFIKISDFTQDASAYEVIQQVMDEFDDMGISGLILDIRGNIGGRLSNAEIIASAFITTPKPTFSTRYRDSSEKSSFTNWVEHKISGVKSPFSLPVAVLTNRLTYSAAETFLLMVRNQDHVRLIGDVTGGGAGNTISRYLTNGWILRMSNSQKRMLDEAVDFQKIGITPDIQIVATSENANLNIDEILEQAILELKGD